ncbi:MAG TPA: spore cortex biosynthesis protein YabQ [Tissierellaceae bacterium]
MDTTMLIELHVFLSTIYGGLISGFIYDVYRTIRYFSKPRKFITHIGDFLFWTLLALIFFVILMMNNWAEIRGYTLIGFFLGILIYNKIFSRFLYPVCIIIGRFLKEFFGKVLAIIFFPFRLFKKFKPALKKTKRIVEEKLKEKKILKKIIFSKK